MALCTRAAVEECIRAMNFFKTSLLLAALTGLFLAVGYLLGGGGGMVFALVIALAMNLFAYWNSDRLVLAMHRAREVDRNSAPEYWGIVAELAGKADLPMPRVYVMDNDQPNAFATGRDPKHAAVAATTGLLRLMSREEIAGVVAHELAHIKNRDTLIMTMTATIAGAISMLANFAMWSSLFGGRRDNGLGAIGTIAMVILAPLAAALVQMAISRAREYHADRRGAEICGQPLWLASALAKLEGAARRFVNEPAERNPASAHLFIVNPLSGAHMDNLFSTHPATRNRIAALEEMAREAASSGAPAARPARAERAPGPWDRAREDAGRRRGPWG